MPLKPIICRVGTKKDIAQSLIDIFPAHNIYVEPFIGGAAVFFRKDPSPIEVINDLDKSVAMTYMALKKLKNFNFNGLKDLNTLEKIKEFWIKPVRSVEHFLSRQIIKYCNGFGGSLVRGVNSIYGKANPYNKLKNAKLYQDRLADVNIHNESYDTILNAYDSSDAFFFMDPPYKGTESLYEANRRGGFDFVKFRNDVARLEGKFLITINDDPELRELFRDFYIQPFIIKRKNRKGIGSKDRNEILISNYEF